VGRRRIVAIGVGLVLLVAGCTRDGTNGTTAGSVPLAQLRAPDAIVGVARAGDVAAVGAALRANPDVQQFAPVRRGMFTDVSMKGLSVPTLCDGGGFVVDLGPGTDVTKFAESLPRGAQVTPRKHVEASRRYNRVLFARLDDGPIVSVIFSRDATPAQIAALATQPGVLGIYRFTDEQYLATFPASQRGTVPRPLATVVVANLRRDGSARALADRLEKLPGVDATQPRALVCDGTP
jgi:hypothetical protein